MSTEGDILITNNNIQYNIFNIYKSIILIILSLFIIISSFGLGYATYKEKNAHAATYGWLFTTLIFLLGCILTHKSICNFVKKYQNNTTPISTYQTI